ITLEEFNQILNIFPQDSFQRIVLLIGFHTGMRRGEIIALKWDAPLEFFFLDEGFGSLDSELLEIVIESLERLHSNNLSVGIISH
ncbi:hypothetical protein ACTPEM_26070, partial [Clostridioides difficile]